LKAAARAGYKVLKEHHDGATSCAVAAVVAAVAVLEDDEA
jgi:hypothetical protein